MEPLAPEPWGSEVTEDYPLVAIVGPTAAGKSALALLLAESFDGEIVSYDSVQVYQGFDIGSGKLSIEARRGIPHYLLDCRRPAELFTAGDYRQEAVRVLAEIRKRAKLPILVGGTGLYLRALLLGLFDGPQRSEVLRARLRSAAKRRGHEFLHRMLGRLDPASAARIHPHDTQKIVRALEVCILRRAPFSDGLARGRSALAGYRTIKVGLNPYRKKLAERINRRVEQMFAGGLLEEARSLLARFDAALLKPLEALGYRQACAALREEITIEEAIRETQAATRQYAKRQMTWFRRERDVKWFDGFGDDPVIASAVTRWLHPLVREGRSPGPEPSSRASKD